MRFSPWLLLSRFGISRSRRERGRKQPRRKATLSPRCEHLEDRTVPSTLMVTNNSDSGSGSLRFEVDHSHRGDTIRFAASLSGQTITLTSGELTITHNL